MTETQAATTPRPEILRDTAEDTPIWSRPSTWTGLGKLSLEGAALATAAAAIPPETPGWARNLLLAAALMKFGSSVFGQVSTWFVRAGVTSLDSKVETVAARTEEAVKPVVEQAKVLEPVAAAVQAGETPVVVTAPAAEGSER